ncbi:hypothetical protein HKCCE3408_08820 [Rhodobacterales bacterium HKCCE3408]|nr:hypothetical protein [Rhodobacterales bacterium HKCCE3408]
MKKMTFFHDFMVAEDGFLEADTMVLGLLMGVVFVSLFAFSGNWNSSSTTRLHQPSGIISSGFDIDDRGTRLPQIGPRVSNR